MNNQRVHCSHQGTEVLLAFILEMYCPRWVRNNKRDSSFILPGWHVAWLDACPRRHARQTRIASKFFLISSLASKALEKCNLRPQLSVTTLKRDLSDGENYLLPPPGNHPRALRYHITKFKQVHPTINRSRSFCLTLSYLHLHRLS